MPSQHEVARSPPTMGMPCGPCFCCPRGEPNAPRDRNFAAESPLPSPFFPPSAGKGDKATGGGGGGESASRRGRPEAVPQGCGLPAKRWDSVESDTDDASEVGNCYGFHHGRMGPDLRLADADGCSVERVGGIGGSRMVLSTEGLTAGMAEWTVSIDRAGLAPSAASDDKAGPLRTFKGSHTLRQSMTRTCGIRIGVGNAGANCRWFVGYDSRSMGLHSQGGVWTAGERFQAQCMDRDQRTASFGAGDRVTVTADLDSNTLKFSINDAPVPGVHYLHRLRAGEPVFLAVSLLWPGEMVTMVQEDIYESENVPDCLAG